MSTVAPSLPRHAGTYARAAWAFLSYAVAVRVLHVATPSAPVQSQNIPKTPTPHDTPTNESRIPPIYDATRSRA
jgi:hypothetical protein